MRAIIIDDEKHVREAIKLLVPWEQYGIEEVFEAQDGLEASRMIVRERPQLIFTDMMMPQKSGVELLDWLQEHYPHGKTIVISGHDDFELLRHTIKAGSVDYILKPIDADQLLSAVSKAVTQWQQEEAERLRQTERNIERNQFKPVYWEKILSNLIAEPTGYESHAEALTKEFGLSPAVTTCRLGIISLDTMTKGLKEKFAANKDLLFFSLTNIANELLIEGGERRGVAYRYWNSEDEIAVLLFSGLAGAESLLSRIQSAINDVYYSTLDIGVSMTARFPSGMTQAYMEARKALRTRNLLSGQKEVHVFDPASPSPGKLLSFTDYSEGVYLAVRSGSEDQIHRSLDVWLQAVRELKVITIDQLELWWYEYNVMRSRWLSELFGEQPPPLPSADTAAAFFLPLDSEGMLSIELWGKELSDSLIDLSKRFLSFQHRESNVIFDIAKYIQNHYHQDITLQEIANHFYLSREYISRKFKQEFQINLSDYISSIRIDKAKLLLLNPNLRISQVAAMVGYEDEKYFSKVFKKMVGLSPNEFRKVKQP
ncbi:response regulator [Paenibacillus sp. GD4]|uniref:response regulator n=1 Tax=Paenibacillus sp. GD4 TaxID=3068890 RepID=UPI0027966C00|nr:response regulator [Paenibacillus sp. GD4]MDQ1910140.1 response regulator [Paenibacillus sp. GD4]